MLFEFEEDNLPNNKSSLDEYDLELGMVLSKSLVKEPGSQILSPKEVQKMVDEKLLNI